MNIMDANFKLPEVAFGARISASNLTNWYDRKLVNMLCIEKDGWKRFSAADVFHIALVRQLMTNGVPIPYANAISLETLEKQFILNELVDIPPLVFVTAFTGVYLEVVPNGEEFLSAVYDKEELEGKRPPEPEVAFVTVPLGPVFHRAISRAMTGDSEAVVELRKRDFDKYMKATAEWRAHGDPKRAWSEAAATLRATRGWKAPRR